jgi:hypothetical protein
VQVQGKSTEAKGLDHRPVPEMLRPRCWQRDIADREMAIAGRGRISTLAGCEVRPISRSEAAGIILRYEWMGTMPRGRVAQYGLFAADGELLGAVVLGRGGGTAAADLCGPSFRRKAICLQRGACVPWAPACAASYLLARAFRLAHRDHGWTVIFAYSDAAAGEAGVIYQALNGLYIGARTGRLSASRWRPSFLHRATGQWLSEKAVRARVGRVDAITGGQRGGDLRRDPAWLVVNRPERARYVWFVGSRKERRDARAALRYPILPYPQRSARTDQPTDLRLHIPPDHLARHEADQAAAREGGTAPRRRRSETRSFSNTLPMHSIDYPVGLRTAIYTNGKGGTSAEGGIAALGSTVVARQWSLIAAFHDEPKMAVGRAALLKAVERDEVDVVLVASVTCIARSLPDLLDLLLLLRPRGVALVALDASFDTFAPAGQPILNALELLGGLTSLFSSERARDGAAKARATGTRLGRPSLDQERAETAVAMLAEGRGVRETARLMQLSAGTISKLRRQLHASRRAMAGKPVKEDSAA